MPPGWITESDAGLHAMKMKDPRAVEAFTLGVQAVGLQHWEEGRAHFEKAVRWDPENPTVWYNIACCNVRLQEWDKAIISAKRCLKLDPKYANAQICLAQSLANKQDYVNAVEAYLLVIKDNPQELTAHVNMANCLEQLKMHEEAIECFSTAIALGGDRAAALSAMHYNAMHACRWDISTPVEEALQWHLAHGGKNNCGPFQLFTVPSATRQQHLEAAKNHWNTQHGNIKPMEPPGPRRAADPDTPSQP